MTTENTVDGTSGTTTTTTTQGVVETPEQKLEKKLSDEAASWRVKFRGAEETIGKLSEEVKTLKGKLDNGTAPSTPENLSELASLKRQLSEMSTTLKAKDEKEKVLEDKARKKTINAALSKLASDLSLNERDTALELLERKAKVADDDVVVFTVRDKENNKDIEVEATPENLKKHGLLPAIFYPAQGVPGTGSRVTGGKVDVGIDLERAKTDNEYYSKNRDAILGILRQKSG